MARIRWAVASVSSIARSWQCQRWVSSAQASTLSAAQLLDQDSVATSAARKNPPSNESVPSTQASEAHHESTWTKPSSSMFQRPAVFQHAPSRHWVYALCKSDPVQARQLVTVLRDLTGAERADRIASIARQRLSGLRCVVEGLYDLGNIGAIVRTMDALGLQHIDVVKVFQDDLYKTKRRVSSGADKWVDVSVWGDVETSASDLKARGFQVGCSICTPTSMSLYDVDFSQPTALIFGNEHAGVSEKAQASADFLFHVPMHGFVSSLNVSVAAALTLGHASAQRRKLVGSASDMTEDEQILLEAEFLARSLFGGKMVLERARKFEPLIRRLASEYGGDCDAYATSS